MRTKDSVEYLVVTFRVAQIQHHLNLGEVFLAESDDFDSCLDDKQVATGRYLHDP